MRTPFPYKEFSRVYQVGARCRFAARVSESHGPSDQWIVPTIGALVDSLHYPEVGTIQIFGD